jgi:hypothetical protein
MQTCIVNIGANKKMADTAKKNPIIMKKGPDAL